MNQVQATRIWALEGLRGMDFQKMSSVIQQLLDKPDCSHKVAFLDINEVYGVADLESEHAKTLLHQKINRR